MKSLLSLLLAICLMNVAVAADTKKPADYAQTVQQIQEQATTLINHYNKETEVETIDGFSKLYFDYYEGSGMELAVAAISPSINVKTESLFTQLIGGASQSATKETLQKTLLQLQLQLNLDLQLLNNQSANHFTGAFLQAFSILLREGFEAMLIVTALLTYLRRSEHRSQEKIIYYGVAAALVASVITAFLFMTWLKNLGAQREAIEGLTMLFASAVMFYVSYWLLAKREATKWQNYIKSQVKEAISSKSAFALGLAAFLAVYREGAETILFYQALFIGNATQMPGIITGFAAACIALFVLYKAMQVASFKMPYRFFFTATAIFLYYMAFSFIGNGILELQQAGWISITPIENFPHWPWLGIFPAWQNVGAQLAFLLPTLGLLLVCTVYQSLKRAPSHDEPQ